jgi:hypothetical protein
MIFTQIGTNHPWVKGIQVGSNQTAFFSLQGMICYRMSVHKKSYNQMKKKCVICIYCRCWILYLVLDSVLYVDIVGAEFYDVTYSVTLCYINTCILGAEFYIWCGYGRKVSINQTGKQHNTHIYSEILLSWIRRDGEKSLRYPAYHKIIWKLYTFKWKYMHVHVLF